MKKVTGLLLVSLIAFSGCKKEDKELYEFNKAPYETLTIDNPTKIDVDELKDYFTNGIVKIQESYTYVSDESVLFEKELQNISKQEKVNVDITTFIGGSNGFELSVSGNVEKNDAINYQYNRTSQYNFVKDLIFVNSENGTGRYNREFYQTRNSLKESNGAIVGNLYEKLASYITFDDSTIENELGNQFNNYCKNINSAMFSPASYYGGTKGRYSNVEVEDKFEIGDITVKHRKETVFTYEISNDKLVSINYSYTYYTNGRNDGELYKKESKIYKQLVGKISFEYGDQDWYISHNNYDDEVN